MKEKRGKENGYVVYDRIVGGLAALDLGIKGVIESEEDDTFPKDLPSARDLIKVYENHNVGFSFGFVRERPELVRGIPLMVISAMADALCAPLQDRGKTAQRTRIAIIIGGALDNLYNRVVQGYVVGYFSIEWEPIKKVVFNLGDMFIFLGSAVIMLGQIAKNLTKVRKRK